MKKEFSRVFIKDEFGDILIMRDKKRPGIWNIPGGKQEPDEKPVDCAIREVREELSLDISDLEEIYSNDLVFNDEIWGSHFYFANTAKGKPTLNEPNKIEGVQFIDDLTKVEFSTGLNPLFDYIKNNESLSNKVTSWK